MHHGHVQLVAGDLDRQQHWSDTSEQSLFLHGGLSLSVLSLGGAHGEFVGMLQAARLRGGSSELTKDSTDETISSH